MAAPVPNAEAQCAHVKTLNAILILCKVLGEVLQQLRCRPGIASGLRHPLRVTDPVSARCVPVGRLLLLAAVVVHALDCLSSIRDSIRCNEEQTQLA